MKQDKYLFIDLETSGLEPEAGVHHLSGIIEVGGKIQERFDLRAAPLPTDTISEKALEICGVTREQIFAYKPAATVHKVFTALLGKYVDKFQKTDKYVICGYNVGYDDMMLRSWFKKLGDQYYGSWIHPYRVDVYTLTAFFRYFGYLDTTDLKLPTVAKHLGFEHDAHKSLSDIEVTRKIFHWCGKHIVDPTKLQATMAAVNTQIGDSIKEVKFDESGREDAQQHDSVAGEG